MEALEDFMEDPEDITCRLRPRQDIIDITEEDTAADV